ncbi:MAG: Asp-tRNA(Asn)/Glu-tRNA(Gln) amidotransferase GatCAB subunit A [Rhodospirillaceae bacterium]|nr:Asp-tRNA(Asn)/Glu-tRNA(Gln) amidotransferase GatCAB subunit A [Rhodospirillaceae bacterium]|tara:strand:+ start:427 stop:1992 length:1566 start_codon:yes stop_codon:yes gene_type:complete
MARGPEMPTIEHLQKISNDFSLNLSLDDLNNHREAMHGAIENLRRIDDLPSPTLDVNYPRTPGHRPQPEENPYNAWYWRTNIKGAPKGILNGYEVGIKDMVSVAGVPMMNGARAIEGFTPTIDATIVTRILDAGADIVGKTACADFSFSGGGHTSAYGPIKNPRKPTHSPGGSSKGSAVALAAGDVPLAIGGDQGGSIRIPSAWCGVVGHKPTYGLVPYTGCMTIEMTLDHIGPMANSVEDAAKLLEAITGSDGYDPRQRGINFEKINKNYSSAIGKGCEGVCIGILQEGFNQTVDTWGNIGLPPSDPIVDSKVLNAINCLEKAGADIQNISVPLHIDGLSIWFGVAAEGTTEFMFKGNGTGTNWSGFYDVPLLDHLAKSYKTRAHDFPLTVKNLILLGEYLNRQYNGRYYAKAQNLTQTLRNAYDKAFEKVDVLVMPTIPHLPCTIPPYDADFGEYMTKALNMINNTPQFNLTGHPAISIPCGMHDGLPIGLQIVGKQFDDYKVIQVADSFEKLGNWKEL